MNHRTAIAKVGDLALRAGSTAGRTLSRAATTAALEATARLAEHRSRREVRRPPGRAPGPTPPPSPAVPVAEPARRTVPSPSQVARAVSHNSAGLARTNPARERRATVRRSVPGAKLPTGTRGLPAV